MEIKINLITFYMFIVCRVRINESSILQFDGQPVPVLIPSFRQSKRLKRFTSEGLKLSRNQVQVVKQLELKQELRFDC